MPHKNRYAYHSCRDKNSLKPPLVCMVRWISEAPRPPDSSWVENTIPCLGPGKYLLEDVMEVDGLPVFPLSSQPHKRKSRAQHLCPTQPHRCQRSRELRSHTPPLVNRKSTSSSLDACRNLEEKIRKEQLNHINVTCFQGRLC